MQAPKQKTIIGQSAPVSFPEYGMEAVAARIDTGARTSTIWVSQVAEQDGRLAVVFFGEGNAHYTGEAIFFDSYDVVAVASSNGHVDERYRVQMSIKIGGRRIRSYFTLADRSTQVYPVLIGRNTLRGKFVVDVKQGTVLRHEDKLRVNELQSKLRKDVKEL